jgi:CRP-like cAMP-binding protein
MSSNRILSRLSRQDIALLEPHLEAVDLPVRKTLEVRRKRIDHVYFIEAGFASVVANGTSKPGIEVGIIGREGMTGLAIVLGSDRAQHATYIQVAGKGLRISAARLREADERSNTLHRAMLRYAHAFLARHRPEPGAKCRDIETRFCCGSSIARVPPLCRVLSSNAARRLPTERSQRAPCSTPESRYDGGMTRRCDSVRQAVSSARKRNGRMPVRRRSRGERSCFSAPPTSCLVRSRTLQIESIHRTELAANTTLVGVHLMPGFGSDADCEA